MRFLVIVVVICLFTLGSAYSKIDRSSWSTADHSKFDQLKPKNLKLDAVIESCDDCHNKAHEHVAGTIHWNGGCTRTNDGSKKALLTGDLVHLEATDCMSCHSGFSKEKSTGKKKADCLSCHDTTGLYEIHNDKISKSKLQNIVKGIGTPSRLSCGKCHFHDFSKNKYPQYGDLTSDLNHPSKDIDVHMDKDGNNFNCQNCHYTINHKMAGRRTKRATKSFVTRGAEHEMGEIASCEACHTKAPHQKKPYMNHHIKYISCQTCHIPSFARGEEITPTHHNWKTAVIDTDKNISPTYLWSSGDFDFRSINDPIDPKDGMIHLQSPKGRFNDADVKIYPYKKFTAIRPYDLKTNYLLIPDHIPVSRLSEDDWHQRFHEGMKLLDKSYSGRHGWIKTITHLPVSHMVAPKENALKCNDCHIKNGVLENVSELYIPGRDRGIWDFLGWSIIVLNLLGVGAHASGRIFSGTARKFITLLISIFKKSKTKDEKENSDI